MPGFTLADVMRRDAIMAESKAHLNRSLTQLFHNARMMKSLEVGWDGYDPEKEGEVEPSTQEGTEPQGIL